MAKHHREVEARRHAMLDAYEAEGRDDVRALAGALVRPLASKLADEDGGAQYLQILADLINRPRPVINPADLDDPTSSIFRWRNLVGRLLEDDATPAPALRGHSLRRGRAGPPGPQRPTATTGCSPATSWTWWRVCSPRPCRTRPGGWRPSAPNGAGSPA